MMSPIASNSCLPSSGKQNLLLHLVFFLCVAIDKRNTHVRTSLRADLGLIPCKHIMICDRSRVNASEFY